MSRKSPLARLRQLVCQMECDAINAREDLAACLRTADPAWREPTSNASFAKFEASVKAVADEANALRQQLRCLRGRERDATINAIADAYCVSKTRWREIGMELYRETLH